MTLTNFVNGIKQRAEAAGVEQRREDAERAEWITRYLATYPGSPGAARITEILERAMQRKQRAESGEQAAGDG